MKGPTSIWSRFIRWIDRGVPFLQSQQLLALTPLGFTLFIAPGPGTVAMFAALGFFMALNGIFIWRLLVFVRKHRGVDRLIHTNMVRRFRQGRWFPVIRRRS